MKGSVVVKKTVLIACLADAKIIIRSESSKEARRVVWGQRMIFEDLLDGEFSRPFLDWNEFYQVFGYKDNIEKGLRFIFGDEI